MSATLTPTEPFVAGEKPDPLAYTFKDANGVALTGISGTVVGKFQYRRRGDLAAGTVVDATFVAATGIATVVWPAGAFAVGGIYDAEIWIGNGTNRYDSVKIIYTVRDAVVTAPAI